jgi:hypothetical protein
MRRIYLVLAVATVMATMVVVSALPAFAEDECNSVPLGPGEYGAAICLTDEELALYS